MQTVTLTPTSVLTLPGSMQIQEGWTGPIDAAWCTGTTTDHPRIVDWKESVVSPKAAYDPKYVRLALRHWECRTRVAQWLAEGVSCDVCGGKGSLNFSSRRLAPNHTACPECKGTSYLRQPSPVWHFLDGPGKVEPWLSAALLWASALRAVAGTGPVVGYFAPWHDTAGLHVRDGFQEYSSVFVSRTAGDFPGWSINKSRVAFGLETGHEGKAKADEAALVRGYALLDTAEKLRVAVPDGTPLPLEK